MYNGYEESKMMGGGSESTYAKEPKIPLDLREHHDQVEHQDPVCLIRRKLC